MYGSNCYGLTPIQEYSADQAALACISYMDTWIPSGNFVCQQIGSTITVILFISNIKYQAPVYQDIIHI